MLSNTFKKIFIVKCVGRTTKEETELNEKLNKYLCDGCRKEQERKKKMKKIVDVIALEREMVQRLDILNADTVFLQTDKGQSKINTLIERLHTVRLIKKHFDLIQWLMGVTEITRDKLLDQDEA